MKKVLTLLFPALLLGCRKEDAGIQNSSGGSDTNVSEVYQDLADMYASVELAGDARVYRDTFYFSHIVEDQVPDSLTFRKNVMDQIASEAFRFTFQPAKDKPYVWRHLWFYFDTRFLKEPGDSTIRFQYSLNTPSLFFF